MCGVFAVINPDQSRFSTTDFDAATCTATHRGPDNMGSFSDERVYFGHTRLSIIDLDVKANQPFHFEDLVLTYNGEIYNYAELRVELETLGYDFTTESDTEVVLKAFHKWGGDCFSRFNGMWALAIYNRSTGSTVVSRDRFGQKPLYIHRSDDSTYIASEVQQMRHFWNGEIDYGLIQMFLKEGNFDGGGRTFFSGVGVFPKAHYATINSSNNVEMTRYWDYPSGRIEKTTDQSFSEFETLFEDAVRIRLRSDVPYGFLLSGGVDSTLISAAAEKHKLPDTELPAFTFSAHGNNDELPYAKQVAEMLNLSLSVTEQNRDSAKYLERLRGVVQHMGRGHSSPAVVPVDQLYEIAGDKVSVVLDGQGADELLAGYDTYSPLIVALSLLKGHPRQAMHWIRRWRASGFALTTIFFLRSVLPSPLRKIMRWLYQYEKLYSRYPEIPRLQLFESSDSESKNRNLFNRFLISRHDLGLENLLLYGDVVAMRYSVENRSPFMDYRLVEYAFNRDEKFKLWDGIDKYPLKRLSIFKRYAKILNRKKIGFESPIYPETKQTMVEALKTSPILNWPIFSDQMASFINGPKITSGKYERLLFRLYQVHLWEEIFVSGSASHESTETN
jgi:asparagine synthase (glutamine-hydrolysing)